MNYSLGINWEQNSSVSLFSKNKLIFCSSEERFSNIKNDERFPIHVIRFLIKKYNLNKNNLYNVVYVSNQWTPSYSLTRHYTKFSHEDYIAEQEKIWYPRIFKNKNVSHLKIFKDKIDYNQFPGKNYWNKNLSSIFFKGTDNVSNTALIDLGKKIRIDVFKKLINLDDSCFHFIDHSISHHFYSYYGSKIKKDNVLSLSLDAFGDNVNYSAVLFNKINGKLEYKKLVSGNNFIIGRLYRYITLLSGLKPNEHEYKIMGLAPYCNEKYSEKLLNRFKEFQDVKKCKFVNKDYPKDLFFSIHEIIKYERFDTVASALQRYTEYLVTKWINQLVNKYNISNICCAGGVFMNVKMNMQISKIEKIDDVFIPPSPDDSSQSLGAMYYFNQQKKFNNDHLNNAYLGLEIIDKKIKNLNKKNYKVYHKNYLHIAAKLLMEGKIIARVKGNAEFGARALGHRSILAHPSKTGIINLINKSIKSRDFWMPFAAIIHKKYAKNYLKLNCSIDCYKYMTLCCEVTKKGSLELSNAIHPYDKTCRPQIIDRKDDKDLSELLMLFGKETGIYSLLNTSLNFHGKPLVNDVDDAIKILKKSELHGILFESFLLVKKI